MDRARADGAGTVLLNPLHAETPVLPINPSPYSPSSRRFRSALYLRVEQTAEYLAAPDDVRVIPGIRVLDAGLHGLLDEVGRVERHRRPRRGRFRR